MTPSGLLLALPLLLFLFTWVALLDVCSCLRLSLVGSHTRVARVLRLAFLARLIRLDLLISLSATRLILFLRGLIVLSRHCIRHDFLPWVDGLG
jgi:hypothetical protein